MRKNSIQKFLPLLCFSFACTAFAEHQASLDYPELVVVPRATERLEMENKKEAAGNGASFLSFQVSSATLIAASAMHLAMDKKPAAGTSDYSAIAGIGVGGAWIAATLWLKTMSPYQSAVQEVKSASSSGSSPKDQLARERLAEEQITRISKLARKLKYLSVISHVGASAYVLMNAESKGLAQMTAIASLAAAFVPVVFPLSWESVAEHQDSYKKKIYAPIAQLGWTSLGQSAQLHPTLQVQWGF